MAGSLAVPILCRRCRQLLCTTEQVVEHDTGEGAKRFTYKHGGARNPQDMCTSIFVEVQPWMKALEEDCGEQDESPGVDGKLFCPNPSCNVRIGSYYWQGVQCSCGTWVAPAFQLSKGKVDVATPIQNDMDVSQPRRSALALNRNRPPVIPGHRPVSSQDTSGPS
mmetsp:Transcript_11259/g.41225  ORF Transcript_11259/g.41225 Transcript_11259/m.41225 type:complete len:165 (+) Transcript_11259:67-561(+)